MGGLDTLQALVSDPEALVRVKAFVPIQSPFYGSPVAEWVTRKSVLFSGVSVMLELLKGSNASLQDLREVNRYYWMRGHEQDLERVRNSVKVFSVATWKNPETPGGNGTLLKMDRDRMLNGEGARSDGLVPWQSAVFPGAEYIMLDNVDHAGTVMDTPGQAFDRPAFFRAILKMVLDRVE